jgi:hypothetical protein
VPAPTRQAPPLFFFPKTPCTHVSHHAQSSPHRPSFAPILGSLSALSGVRTGSTTTAYSHGARPFSYTSRYLPSLRTPRICHSLFAILISGTILKKKVWLATATVPCTTSYSLPFNSTSGSCPRLSDRTLVPACFSRKSLAASCGAYTSISASRLLSRVL